MPALLAHGSDSGVREPVHAWSFGPTVQLQFVVAVVQQHIFERQALQLARYHVSRQLVLQDEGEGLLQRPAELQREVAGAQDLGPPLHRDEHISRPGFGHGPKQQAVCVLCGRGKEGMVE